MVKGKTSGEHAVIKQVDIEDMSEEERKETF